MRAPGEGRAVSKQMLRYFLQPPDSCWKSSKDIYTQITGKVQAAKYTQNCACLHFVFVLMSVNKAIEDHKGFFLGC